jgi:uncharacterized membrane protein YjjP (DUF1212 family)
VPPGAGAGAGGPRGSGPAREPRWRLPWSPLRRLLSAEASTEPLSVLEQLRATPYRDPHRMAAPTPAEVRRRLELVVRVATQLLASGAGTAEVEASAVATAIAFGLDPDALDLDVTFTSLVLGYAPEGDMPIALVRVVRAPGRDYARLSALHGLVADLVAGRAATDDVARRLDEIARQPRPYSRWLVTLAYGGLAAAVVVRLGGGVGAAIVAFLVTVVTDRLGRVLVRRTVPAFFVTLVGAALATALAAIVLGVAEAVPWAAGQLTSTGLVVAGSIVVLLPGAALVAAVQDAIRGFPVTAVGRLSTVLLTTAAIIAGVILVLDVAGRLGVRVPVPDAGQRAFVGSLAATVAGGVAAGCGALTARAPLRLLGPAALAGAAGVAVLLTVVRLGWPLAVATAMASTLIGVVGRVLALRRRASPLAVVVPATTPLLPGLVIFESLRDLVFSEAGPGVLGLLEAVTVAVAIGAGVVLGDAMARPVEQGLEVFELRRRRRGPRSGRGAAADGALTDDDDADDG